MTEQVTIITKANGKEVNRETVEKTVYLIKSTGRRYIKAKNTKLDLNANNEAVYDDPNAPPEPSPPPTPPTPPAKITLSPPTKKVYPPKEDMSNALRAKIDMHLKGEGDNFVAVLEDGRRTLALSGTYAGAPEEERSRVKHLLSKKTRSGEEVVQLNLGDGALWWAIVSTSHSPPPRRDHHHQHQRSDYGNGNGHFNNGADQYGGQQLSYPRLPPRKRW